MTVDQIISKIKSNSSIRSRAKSFLNAVGIDTTHWCRVVMYRECFAFIRTLSPEKLDTLEIAAGSQWTREFTFRSYVGTQYPEFDICIHTLPQKFDLIIADQVFEHLRWP